MCVLIICFTLFEVPFPLDDNFLFLYFKVHFQCIEQFYALSPFLAHPTIVQFHVVSLLLAHSTVGWGGVYKLPSSSLAFNGDRAGGTKYLILLSTIPQFALTPLLTKVVKLSTPLIGFLSAASKVSYYLIIANAKSRTMVSSSSKISITIAIKILPDLFSLLGLPWGRGGQHCLQVRLTILWLPNRPL